MAGFDLNEFLNDFAKRTKDNLNMIEMLSKQRLPNSHAFMIKQNKTSTKAKPFQPPQRPVYEVTQLINSLLGLVVFPMEAFYAEQNIDNKTLEEASGKHFQKLNDIINKCFENKSIFSSYEDDMQCITVWSFARHLRNAVSHSGNQGIRFYPIPNSNSNKIQKIIFYDFKKLSYDLYSEFCVELDIKTLKDVVLNLSELFNSVEKKNGLLKKNRTTYEDECKALKKAMENPKGEPVCYKDRIIPLQNQSE